ncbi:U1 [Hyposoter didymator ichnovirus]|nr:U1 [Hyposoter didymator ichnovirus]
MQQGSILSFFKFVMIVLLSVFKTSHYDARYHCTRPYVHFMLIARYVHLHACRGTQASAGRYKLYFVSAVTDKSAGNISRQCENYTNDSINGQYALQSRLSGRLALGGRLPYLVFVS